MSRLNDIYKWYTENNTSDPNMFELIEVLSQHSRMPGDYTDEINQLVELETKRLFENGIITDEADPLVMLITEFQQKALNKEEVSELLAEYAKMVAGISFWIKTQLARTENKEAFKYDNFHEYAELLKKERALLQSGEKLGLNLKQLAEFIAAKFKTDNKGIEESIRELQASTGGYSMSREEQEMAAMFEAPVEAPVDENASVK